MEKLVGCARIEPHDVVLEVGPGTGGLTELLITQAGHVISVEIDRGLYHLCRDRLLSDDDQTALTLLHTDILEKKSQICRQALNLLAEHQKRLKGRILLVANLPYQVATPLLVELIMGDLPVSPLCFTVQAEVADRIQAAPGNKDYGPISVLIQARCHIKRIARLGPEVFWPRPRVDSAMLRIDLHEDTWNTVYRDTFKRVVRVGFAHRRKTLRANLRDLLSADQQETLVRQGGWDFGLRAEMLGVDQWCRLTHDIINIIT